MKTDVKLFYLLHEFSFQDAKTEDAIIIKSGNLSWGFPHKKDKEDLELEREEKEE